MPITLDEFDVKILNIVQRDNRLSTERIAAQVGLSSSAVQRRLRRLRQERIIEMEISVVSPQAVGLTLTAIVAVTLEREEPRIFDQFNQLMIAAPEVMQCYYVTGQADFIVIVTAKDMQDYDAFTRRCFTENPHVKRFNTNIVIRRVKSGLAVPLEL